MSAGATEAAAGVKPIPATFRKHGYDFTLVERVGNVAIYEQAKAGRVYAFEVVKIRVRPAGLQFGKNVLAAEFLPCDEDFGSYGKTYSLSLRSSVEARNAANEQMRVWVAESGGERPATGGGEV